MISPLSVHFTAKTSLNVCYEQKVTQKKSLGKVQGYSGAKPAPEGRPMSRSPMVYLRPAA